MYGFPQNLQHALILFKIVLVIALLVYLKFSYLIRFLIFQIPNIEICSIVFRNILTHVSFSLTPVIINCKLRKCCSYPFDCNVLFILVSIFLSTF